MHTGIIARVLVLPAGLLAAWGAATAEAAEPRRLPAPAEAPGPGGWSDWHWRMMEDGWHSGFGYGHWIFSLIFWVLVIGALLLAVWAVGKRPQSASRRTTPRDILDERYARGEIDREEYRLRRADLDASEAGRSPQH
jgi:putative membrane protein